MTGAEFRSWRTRTGRSQIAAAEVLGWSRRSLQLAEGKPQDDVPRIVTLACAALDAEAATETGPALTMLKAAALHADLAGRRDQCVVQLTISPMGLTCSATSTNQRSSRMIAFAQLATGKIAAVEAAIDRVVAHITAQVESAGR